MKKILLTILILTFMSVNYVSAKEIYYDNGEIQLTKEQYDFFTAMYFDGYQQYITKDDFKIFDTSIMNAENVESNVVHYNIPLGRATSYNDNNKSLKISKASAGTSSIISITLTWNTNPNVKSYDVIGARFSGVSYAGNLSTKLINSNGSSSISNNQTFTNGLGCSVPISGLSIKVTQTFKVTGSGTVYGSYQHANSAISLANSKKYTISSSGYGGVFKFTGTATSVYDQMNGVSITV